MKPSDLLLLVLIGAAAVAYGIFSGRAEASRLRGLSADLSNGKLRGILVIAAVAVMVLASHVF
jgi:hypothetical protein